MFYRLQNVASSSAPSLNFSNLSAWGNKLCFVRGSEVVLTDVENEKSNKMSLPKMLLHTCAYVIVNKVPYIGVATNLGLQMWSLDAETMTFFYALSELLPSSVDPDTHFMRGLTSTPTHVAVGTSFGTVIVFTTAGSNGLEFHGKVGTSRSGIVTRKRIWLQYCDQKEPTGAQFSRPSSASDQHPRHIVQRAPETVCRGGVAARLRHHRPGQVTNPPGCATITDTRHVNRCPAK